MRRAKIGGPIDDSNRSSEQHCRSNSQSEGPIELVDAQGKRVGLIGRPPTADEIEFAKSRIGSTGPKSTIDELIARAESL